MKKLFFFGDSIRTGYLLDKYTNIEAAFSFMKLKKTAIHSCRILRNNDLAETDVLLEEEGSLTLNSLVSAGGTVGAWTGTNSAFIVIWYDQSGLGNNIGQVLGHKQPRIINSGSLLTKNGLAAPRYDGTNEFLQSAALPAFTAGNSWSSFSVAANAVLDSIGNVFCTDNGTTGMIQHFINSSTTGSINLRIGANSVVTDIPYSVPRNVTSQIQGSLFSNGAKYSAYDNGDLGGEYTPAVNNTLNTTFQVGIRSTSSNPVNGYIQELLVFSDSKLLDRKAIEKEINSRYNIY